MYDEHPGEAAVSFSSMVPKKKENSSSKIEDCPLEPMNFAPTFVRSVGYTSL